MKNVAAKAKTTKTKTHVATTAPGTACANCARLLSTLVLALPESDPLRRQALGAEGETASMRPSVGRIEIKAGHADHGPATSRRMSAIEGFAAEGSERLGRLALAISEILSDADGDPELAAEVHEQIGILAMNLRLIHVEASAAVAACDREVPS